jgi:galactose mutarotase-like enzyme
MSGFMGGKLKWAESPNGTNQLSGRQSYAAAAATALSPPTANRIYNNHRQLTWRTTDLYLLAMVAGL